MSKLTNRATEMADLLELSSEVGVAASITDSGVEIVGPGDAPARKIGSNVREAVQHLKSVTVNAGIRPRDGQSLS